MQSDESRKIIEFLPGKLFKLKVTYQGNDFPVGIGPNDEIPSYYGQVKRIVVGSEDFILLLRNIPHHYNACLYLVGEHLVVFYGDEVEPL